MLQNKWELHADLRGADLGHESGDSLSTLRAVKSAASYKYLPGNFVVVVESQEQRALWVS